MLITHQFKTKPCMERSKQNLVWKGVWTTIVWSIWEQRNRVVFKQDKVDVEEIFHLAQLKSWLWLKYRKKTFMHSFPEWIMNPNL